jgi:RNA polymerase sigma-70 factor (ECF subfamily)
LHADRDGNVALLHDRFADEVNGLVWRLLGADNDHDDIVQLVFCRLLTHVHKVREADKLASWVRSVTVNAVYSELRKRGVRRLFFASESRRGERFVDGSSALESRDLLSRVYAELDGMPVAERMAFSLRYIEGKQLADVSELCSCSLATVKRRIARAEQKLEHLRAAFQELKQ